LNHFTIDRVLSRYFKSYLTLTLTAQRKIVPLKPKFQHLYIEKGYALMSIGLWQDAINQFRLAIKEDALSPAVPAILMEIANAYNNLGKYDQVFNELEKAEVIVRMSKYEKIA
jgi:tetratricopeptide (TPR) repeat protein